MPGEGSDQAVVRGLSGGKIHRRASLGEQVHVLGRRRSRRYAGGGEQAWARSGAEAPVGVYHRAGAPTWCTGRCHRRRGE
jgi:hypothetical protein